MKRLKVFLIFLVLTLVSTGVAQADIVFNNFGTGDTYSTTSGWPIDGNVVFAMGFMPNMTANLGSIDFVISHIGGTNEVALSLVNDDQGVPLGSTLESWTFTNEMGAFGQVSNILTADSITHPLLQTGTPYWLIASIPVSDTIAAWNLNSSADTGPISESHDNGSTWLASRVDTRGVFRVNATAVPEPSTIILLGAGLAGVGIMRRRVRK